MMSSHSLMPCLEVELQYDRIGMGESVFSPGLRHFDTTDSERRLTAPNHILLNRHKSRFFYSTAALKCKLKLKCDDFTQRHVSSVCPYNITTAPTDPPSDNSLNS